jgi:hypothetical protein
MRFLILRISFSSNRWNLLLQKDQDGLHWALRRLKLIEVAKKIAVIELMTICSRVLHIRTSCLAGHRMSVWRGILRLQSYQWKEGLGSLEDVKIVSTLRCEDSESYVFIMIFLHLQRDRMHLSIWWAMYLRDLFIFLIDHVTIVFCHCCGTI